MAALVVNPDYMISYTTGGLIKGLYGTILNEFCDPNQLF